MRNFILLCVIVLLLHGGSAWAGVPVSGRWQGTLPAIQNSCAGWPNYTTVDDLVMMSRACRWLADSEGDDYWTCPLSVHIPRGIARGNRWFPGDPSQVGLVAYHFSGPVTASNGQIYTLTTSYSWYHYPNRKTQSITVETSLESFGSEICKARYRGKIKRIGSK